MEDSGDFLNGVLTLGIVHPPGYPLYTILGHLFSYIPLGDPGYRVNLFSALWGALCLGVLFLNLRILSTAPIHAIFVCLSLGFTTVFWSKTAVAEVYSFNVFLLALMVFSILSYNRGKKTWQLYLVGLTTGLALSNHYPLVILSGAGLIFLLDYKDLRFSNTLKASLFMALGLTPYLYLFIQASNPDLQYNFGKSTNFGMVIDHILIRNHPTEYAGTAMDKILLAIWFLREVIKNFFLSSIFLCIGIVVSFLDKRKYRYGLVLAALGPSFGLILAFDFHNDDLYKVYLSDFTIPAFLFASFFLAMGLRTVMNRWVKNQMAQIAVFVLCLATQFGYHFSSASHHNDSLVEIWGTEVLNSMEPNSLLILCGPAEFSAYYLQLVKGFRPDATLYDRFSSWTKKNLYGPSLLFKRKDAAVFRERRERQLIRNSARAIYSICSDFLAPQNIQFTLTPYIFRIDKRHQEALEAARFSVSRRLLDSLVNDYPKNDYWLDRMRKGIFTRLISYYGGHKRPEVRQIVYHFEQTKFYSQPRSLLSLANNLYFLKNYKLARSFFHRAETLDLGHFESKHLAPYCNLLASSGEYDKALAICMRQETSSFPCEANTVNTRRTMVAIYREKRDWSKVALYSRRILECRADDQVARSQLQSALQAIDKNSLPTELIATDEPK